MVWDNFVAALHYEDRLGLVWPMTDTLRMEAAMVLWEAFLDIEGREPLLSEAPMNVYRDRIGTVAARHDLMTLAEPLHIGWHIHEKAAGGDVLVPFDWEFTPWFLRNCVEFEEAGWVSLREGWLDLCRNVRGDG